LRLSARQRSDEPLALDDRQATGAVLRMALSRGIMLEVSSEGDLIDEVLQRLADRTQELFPDADVEVTLSPNGQVAVRRDDVWITPADDGMSTVYTRYDGDQAHVIRLDDDLNELEAYTLRLGDPDSN
jgi:hypothetical protein